VEGGGGLGPRKRNCKRCGGSGHIARTYKNAVHASFGEDEHWVQKMHKRKHSLGKIFISTELVLMSMI
jgi:hypothetical protein